MYLMFRGLRKKYWLILLCFSPATFAFQVYDKQGGFTERDPRHRLFRGDHIHVAEKRRALTDSVDGSAVHNRRSLVTRGRDLLHAVLPVELFQARDKDWRRALGMFSFVAVPAVIVTAAAYLRPGDADVIAAICKSLGGSAPSDCNSADMAAISFLSRSSMVPRNGGDAATDRAPEILRVFFPRRRSPVRSVATLPSA